MIYIHKSPVKIFHMIKTAFGDNSLLERQVFRWHNVFLEGREEGSDEVRVERPLTTTMDENVARVRELLSTDHQLSVRLVIDIKHPKKYRSRDCDKLLQI